MSSIKFVTEYNDSALVSGLQKDNERVKQWSRDAVRSGESVEGMFKRVGQAATAYLSLRFGAQIGNEIIKVRGQFQQLGIAFETMLGSKAKSDQLMQQQIAFAAKTPFTLSDVATNTKQLMAMGVAYEDVMGTMKALGDVAAGVSVPISRVAINYGQVMTLGKLQARELRDFAMAGIPLIDELAKNLGKSKSEITDMISESKIGADEVTHAFMTMSGEGGKFYNLMEKQNASVTGQISNLQDKIEVMLNTIGKSNEGLIYGSIEGLASLVENYETVGKSIMELVAAYGIYKATLITITAIDKAAAATKYTAEAAELTKLLTTEQQAIITKQGLTKGSVEHAAAIKAEIVAEMERQTKLAASVNADVVVLQKKLAARKAEKIAAAESVAAIEAERIAMIKANPYVDLSTINKKLNTAQTKLNTAATAENSAAMQLNSKRAVLDSAVRKANTLETGLNTAVKNANVTSTNILSAAKLRLTAITARMNAIIAANPFTAVAVAVAALGYGIYKLATYETEAEKRAKKLNESIKEFKKNSLSEISTLARLKGELSSLEKGTDAYKKAKDKIVREYGKYDSNLANEIDKVGLTTEAYNRLTKAISKSFGARQYDKFQKEQSDYIGEILSDNLEKIQDKMIEELGDEAGSKYFSKLREALLNQKLSIGTNGMFDIKGLDDDVKKVLDDISGASSSNRYFKYVNYEIEALLKNVLEAQNQVDKLDEKAKQRFGISQLSPTDEVLSQYKDLFKKVNEYTDKELPSVKEKLTQLLGKGLGTDAEDAIKNQINLITKELSLLTNEQEIDKLTKSIDTAKAKLKELRDPNYKSSNRFQEIEDQEKSVKDLEKKLETLTGIRKKEVDKQIKTEEQKLQAAKNLAQQELDIKRKLEDDKVAAMKEGIEKQKAAAKAQYNNDLKNIANDKQNYLDKLNESKGLKITDKGYITKVDDTSNIGKVFSDREKAAKDHYDKNILKIETDAAKKQQEIWDEATEAFLSDIDKQKKAINQKYDDLVKQAKLAGMTEEEISQINISRQKELQQTQADTALKLSGFYKKAFGDIDKYGFNTLNKLKDQINDVIDSAKQVDQDGKTLILVDIPSIDEQGNAVQKQVKMTIEEFNQLRNKANEINSKLESKNPFIALENSYEKLIKALNSGDKREISDALENFIKNADVAVNSVKELADAIGGDLGDTIDTITNIADGVLSIAEGIAAKDPAEVLKGIVQLYKTIKAASEEYKLAQEEWMHDLIDLQLEYNATLNEQLRIQKQQTVFIDDYAAAIMNASQAMADAQKNLNDELKINVSVFNGQYKELIEQSVSLIEYLSQLEVKTGVKQTGLFGWGSANVYGSLLEIYPELIDAQGNFNEELAQTLLNNDALWTNMNEDSRQALEALIEYQSEIEAANDAIESAISSMAGFISNNLQTALVDSWEAGTSSFEAFQTSVSSGLNKIAQDLIFNQIFSSAFKDLQSNLANSFDIANGGDGNILDDFQAFFAQSPELLAQWQQAMADWNKAASEAGFDVTSTNTSSSYQGNTIQASQESVSLLTGQIQAARIDLKGILESNDKGVDIMQVGINHLSKIEENTSHNSALPEIKQQLESLNKTFEEIKDNKNNSMGNNAFGG